MWHLTKTYNGEWHQNFLHYMLQNDKDNTIQLGISNLDDFFQTRILGLDALKPGFRVQVLQIWREEDKWTTYTACTSERITWKCI